MRRSDCPAGRVTSTRAPRSGARARRRGKRRREAVSPTINTAGGAILRARASPAILPSVPATILWRGVQPFSTIAAGRRGLFPALRKRATISPRFRTPIKTTNVESALRTRPQSTPPTPRSASWPVRIVTEELSPRKVSGIPAAEGTASAAETPGTISQGIPARARYRASSAPRPNSIGSPPLSRTTVIPARAARTSARLMRACSALLPPPAFPTQTLRAPERAWRSSAGCARWS